MSDCSTVEVRILKADADKMIALLGNPDEIIESTDHCVRGYYFDACGAYTTEFHQLANDGCTFVMVGDGLAGGWDAFCMVGLDGLFIETPYGTETGMPMATFNHHTGKLHAPEKTKTWSERYLRACEKMGVNPNIR